MKTFQDLGINNEVLRAITEMGYESPMPVQEAVIPLLLEDDRDIVALAQTGTGKTAAFGLPTIQKVDLSLCQPQVLILSPTRELCLQIAADLSDYSKYVKGLKILPVYGGSSIESQIRSLRSGVHIVVATPGRLIDLINRNTVKLENVRTVVMDEADEMLNMGFTDSINEILEKIPPTRQTLLFSATMPAEISRISKKYLNNHREITVGTKNEGSKNVRHLYYMVHAKDKYASLKRIADSCPSVYGIIFCRTRRDTQEIADKLIQDGYNADSLHGDLSQAQRDSVMQKFRVRHIQLLVATDVAARGLDVNDLTHVINYGLPDDVETYTHRSGRTGRAGKSGTSVAIIHTKEKGRMKEIERIIGKQFERAHVPTGKEICEKQLYSMVDRLEKVKVNEEEIEAYLPPILRRLEWLSTEDLVKRFVSMEFNRLLDYYKDAKELEVPDERPEKRERRDGLERGERRGREIGKSASNVGEPGFTRLYLNLGKADGIYPNTLIELMNNFVVKRVQVGKIELTPSFSMFDVPERDARMVINSMRGGDFYGKRISIEVASNVQSRPSRSGAGKRERPGGSFGRSEGRGDSSRPKYGSDRASDKNSKGRSKKRHE